MTRWRAFVLSFFVSILSLSLIFGMLVSVDNMSKVSDDQDVFVSITVQREVISAEIGTIQLNIKSSFIKIGATILAAFTALVDPIISVILKTLSMLL